jgi:DNA-directed RNA polymerase specialized sigma24 family protein
MMNLGGQPGAHHGERQADPLAAFAESIAGGTAEIDPETAHAARQALHRHLARRFPSISSDDLDDVSNEAVARIVEKSLAGALHTHPNPAAYLQVTADRIALDHLRSARRTREVLTSTSVEFGEVALTDDGAAAFDRRATAEMVRDVLRHLEHDDDAVLFRIATYILDEVQRTGLMPSNRQTARACAMSHTAVAKALRRLRAYFPTATD